MSLDREDIPRSYALRYRPRATRDIDIESVRLAEIQGDEIALDWLEKIQEAIGSLSVWPRRFAIAPEENLIERRVRVMLFRRTPGGPAWRVFYTVEDEGEDGFVVRIRHIRHGASPLSEHDLQELLTDA
ncbi:type II toxin-antitoxin system RelE/ParE family toxin [Armatimonas sp.]|uniref:type II toxin-antitoxin system RelE/ParE family toxin n=1 Tax=Armatimonas sp. TaxID=1872638 RepID=UPI0037503223